MNMRTASFFSLCTLAVALALGASACTLFVNTGLAAPQPLPGDAELQSFQRSFMTSFEIARGAYLPGSRALTPFGADMAPVASRATVPVFGSSSIAFPGAGATLNGSKADYPEPGQNSSWTVVRHASLANCYQVTVTTLFPSYDPREKQVETYLVRDQGSPSPDGLWTSADLVVNASGVQDDAYRLYNRLNFRDGSYQDEVITAVMKPTTAGNMRAGFAAWDVSASLDYPALFNPVTDSGSSYSSVVAYTRSFSDAPSYSFWAGNRAQSVVGVRYYTEHLNAARTQLIADMLLFEKALGSNPNPVLLSQSFLRQEIVYAWNDSTKTATYSSASRDTRMKTTVVNISGQADYYLTRINDEATQLLNGSTSITIPSGDATEVLASTPAAAVDVKQNNLTVKTGDLQPMQITNNSPSGDLGTLWVSLDSGVASNAPTTSDISGDLIGTTDIKQFSGKQGIAIPGGLPTAYTASGDVSVRGTVQAWVYINAQSNTAGIVHCGTRSDFYDEVWSLQFMGSNGQVGLSLSTNDGLWTPAKYSYDWAGSTYNLNTKKWYYLVATWDRSLGATNSYIKLYINGVLNKTGTLPKCTKAGAAFGVTNPTVLVGSQFYDATKVLSGYYGFNGKINGVQVDTAVWTAQNILDFYNANQAKTSGW